MDGLGLFASRVINRGEMVVQGEVDWSAVEWKEYMAKNPVPSCSLVWKTCMINHSSEPNAGRGRKNEVFASRTIKKGEEVTEDYYSFPPAKNPFNSGGDEQVLFEKINEDKVIELKKRHAFLHGKQST